ncbi:MAG: caspase family protein [Spirochaetes bacterium]|nr:caspase family protein [Spirochaetota bacterium]
MDYLKIIFIVLYLSIISYFINPDNEKGLRVKIKDIKGNEGKRWAICVGINDYNDDNIVDLKNARNDAVEIGKVFEEKGQFDKVIVIVDDYQHFQDKNLPTKLNIEKKIEYILSFSSPDDLLVFTFSGHGISDDKGEGYLITLDTDINKKFETSLKVNDIVKKFNDYSIKKSLLILDACREQISQTKSIGNKGLLAEMFKESELAAAFYSTKAGWFSYEDTETKFGVFTRFLLEGLNGKADSNDDNVVSFSELENFVQEEVNNFSLKNNKKQKPYTKIFGEKFGDLALTSYSRSLIADNSIKESFKGLTSGELSNFKASLKKDEEHKTVLLTWSRDINSRYDNVIILRSNIKIDYNLKDNVNYIESELISGTDITVLKILDKDAISYSDTNLKDDTQYFYKIFTKINNNGIILYSKNQIITNIKTKADVENINFRMDSIKVVEVFEENKSWGVELIWKIELKTSDGEKFLIHERKKDNYKAFSKDTMQSFNDSVDFSITKKKSSYFDVIVEMWDIDTDVKDGWIVENQTDDCVINKKIYRYNYSDEKSYGQHIITEQEDKSCKVELKWTINKNR